MFPELDRANNLKLEAEVAQKAADIVVKDNRLCLQISHPVDARGFKRPNHSVP